MSKAIIKPLSSVEAEELTATINSAAEGLGELLLTAHDRKAWEAMGYDSWRAYAVAEFRFSKTRVYELLDFQRTKNVLTENSDLSENLPTSTRQTRELAKLDPAQQVEAWGKATKAAKAPGKPTAKEVQAAVKEVVTPTRIESIACLDGIVTDLSELIEAGAKFGTIYADPPWSYSNQATRAATSNHYDSLSVNALCELPVAQLSAEKCHLHLWTTNAFLFECPRILAAWGFEFRSTFVWVKPQIGIGNYWRNSHEIMLLAIKGGQRAVSRSERSWMESPRGVHSAKPEAARQAIERLSPGPYLELFGRSPRTGWTVYGNQNLPELAEAV